MAESTVQGRSRAGQGSFNGVMVMGKMSMAEMAAREKSTAELLALGARYEFQSGMARTLVKSFNY